MLGIRIWGEKVVVVFLKCMRMYMIELVKGRGGEWGYVDRFVLKKGEIVWSMWLGWVEDGGGWE